MKEFLNKFFKSVKNEHTKDVRYTKFTKEIPANSEYIRIILTAID